MQYQVQCEVGRPPLLTHARDSAIFLNSQFDNVVHILTVSKAYATLDFDTLWSAFSPTPASPVNGTTRAASFALLRKNRWYTKKAATGANITNPHTATITPLIISEQQMKPSFERDSARGDGV